MLSIFKKLLKLTLKTVIIIVVLMMIVTALVSVFFDINQYKSVIIKEVKNETGLTLQFNSDLNLSVFSGLKFKATNVQLFQKSDQLVDIESLSIGLDMYSLYQGEAKVTSIDLNIRSLNLTRNIKGQFNFLPVSIDNTSPEIASSSSDNNDLLINKLFIENIKVFIQQFQYQDKIETINIKLDGIKTSMTVLPIIDHHTLVVDDPRIIMDYSYSGQLSFKKARINQIDLSDFQMQFNDHLGDFFAKNITFKLAHKNTDQNALDINLKAQGKFQFKFVYQTPSGADEPIWEQPELIKVAAFDLSFPQFKLSNPSSQIDIQQSHLSVDQITFYKNSKSLLDDMQIKSLKFNSKLINARLEGKETYHLKKFFIQIQGLPISHKGTILVPDSPIFLKQFAQNSRIQLSIDKLSTEQQGFDNIQVVLTGKDNKIHLSTLSLKAIKSIVKGKGSLDVSKKNSPWSLNIQTDPLNLKPLVNLLSEGLEVDGFAKIDASLAGTFEQSQFDILTGKVHAQARDLRFHGLDIDETLNQFENSQKVGLLDVGAIALLGPAGIVLSKSNDYHGLASTLNNEGISHIKQVNSDVNYNNGIATMNDVAFSTKNHRLAIKGKINTLKDTFLSFEVATIDNQGCAIYKEEVSGSLSSPSVKKANVLIKSVINPVTSLLYKATDALQISCKEPFYTGLILPNQ